MDELVILGHGSGEYIEKKSRFIAMATEIHSEADALCCIEETRKRYWDARHNCYAYILGPGGRTRRFSDDKEPQGTAGKPILDVLTGANVTNILMIVTRYFGGVLLGTGGLVRAYSAASAAALNSLKEGYDGGCLTKLLYGKSLCLSFDYKSLGQIDALAARFGISINSKEYLDEVVYKMTAEKNLLDNFIKEAMNATRGSLKVEIGEDMTYCIKDGIVVPYML